MHEERALTIGVECYAGHRGEQTPRTLILGDRRTAVAEVLAAGAEIAAKSVSQSAARSLVGSRA